MLAKGSAEITLLDVISVLEGPICVVDCVDEPETCERSDTCVTRCVWGRVESAIKETMKGITLTELVNDEKDLEARVSLSYVI